MLKHTRRPCPDELGQRSPAAGAFSYRGVLLTTLCTHFCSCEYFATAVTPTDILRNNPKPLHANTTVCIAANGAWKTNPLFDGPGPEKAPLPQPQIATPPAPSLQAESAPPLDSPIHAQTKTAASPISSHATPLPKSTTPHPSLSAQAQTIVDQLLAKVGAAVSRAGAKSDGGTQTTPSLELLALEDRPHRNPPVLALPPIPNPEPASLEKRPPPPGSERGGDDGSPLLQDVSAAMAMAAQVADDIDFPAPDGSPPPADGVRSGEGEQGPRKLAFGSPVDAGQHEGGDTEDQDQPDALDDPSEVREPFNYSHSVIRRSLISTPFPPHLDGAAPAQSSCPRRV